MSGLALIGAGVCLLALCAAAAIIIEAGRG
jgi:hypothetical protein